jgi:glyoxylase-like metal-dependent hydrolase (beta-lactamase superfamily II)
MDLNVGLVVGHDACLVIDTRCSQAEGSELAAAVRAITPVPWTVVTTHAHFDHCFGTAAFLPAAVWAHERCAAAIRHEGSANRERMAGLYDADGQDGVARDIRASPLVVPDRFVDRREVLDVGGRVVELKHPGRGHTDHDLVVVLPEDGVLFAGDLVEQGAPPQFHDAFPLDWPATLDVLLASGGVTVVPGHGDVVDRRFVSGQRDLLAELVGCSVAGWADDAVVEEVATSLPGLGSFAVQAVQRAYWQLGAEDDVGEQASRSHSSNENVDR